MPHTSRTPAVAAVALAAALALAPAVQAQSAASVRNTVQRALQTNPEVGSRLHAYLAQAKAIDAAASAWRPKLDLAGDAGVERTRDANNLNSTIKKAGMGLSVSQLLWDGLGTQNEVARATHERLARWFEFVDATEQTALDATRALYDVQRQRRLVQLADGNLLNHRNAVGKLESRVRAGVGRGVDLDQARARLALAESNLETELANLHDVAARFQRVVGETPQPEAGKLELLQTGLPGSATEAVQAAIARSPAIAAAVEGVRAAKAGEAVRRSALQPRIEARARAGGGHNYTGIEGRRGDAGVEVVLNWNLYNGGGDSARIAQQQALINQAAAQRDKACTDSRQTALTAFNDAQKLGAQIATLERNTAAIERARDAYAQQFDIGQRSLLDLLNAENEAYTARRALLNAEYDRALAYARTHAAMNQLNTQLGLSREANTDLARGWQAGEEGAQRCPAQPVDLQNLRPAPPPAPAPQAAATAPASPVAALAGPAAAPATGTGGPSATAPGAAAVYAPALGAGGAAGAAAALGAAGAGGAVAMPVRQSGAVPAAGAAAAWGAGSAAGPATTAAGTLVATPLQANPLPGGVSQAVAERVEAWARAQRSKDMAGFAALYMPEFAGDDGSAQMWRAGKLRQFSQRGVLGVKVTGLSTTELPDGQVETRFRLITSTASYREAGDKVLVWKIVDGQWRITKEVTL